jgi:hypothetical protein
MCRSLNKKHADRRRKEYEQRGDHSVPYRSHAGNLPGIVSCGRAGGSGFWLHAALVLKKPPVRSKVRGTGIACHFQAMSPSRNHPLLSLDCAVRAKTLRKPSRDDFDFH